MSVFIFDVFTDIAGLMMVQPFVYISALFILMSVVILIKKIMS